MIASILNRPPLLPPDEGNAEWNLAEPLYARIETDDGEDSITICVPAGFGTDLDSVPRWLPGAYAMFKGRAIYEAILHDRLYQLRMPRAWSDDVFLAVMKKRVAAIYRYPMWLAVRIGGAAYYADQISQPNPETERQAP